MMFQYDMCSLDRYLLQEGPAPIIIYQRNVAVASEFVNVAEVQDA